MELFLDGVLGALDIAASTVESNSEADFRGDCVVNETCRALSPFDWNRFRFCTSNFAKSHDLAPPLPGGS